MRTSTASAPGKVILIGEHFVVSNEPAIVAAISLRARATASLSGNMKVDIFSRNLGTRYSFAVGEGGWGDPSLIPMKVAIDKVMEEAGRYVGLTVTIDSEIPIASGLGSSAAVAVATIAAVSDVLGMNLSKDGICRIAYEAEKEVHGSPSGIDNAISTYGGIIAFRKGEEFVRLEDTFKGMSILIADTGIQRRTKEMVMKVQRLRMEYEDIMMPLFHAAGHLAIEAAMAIREGNMGKLGELMNINHGLLSAIGVSTLKLEELVHAARRAGALGAKITGAGGGGSIVVLCHKHLASRISNELAKVGCMRVLESEIACEGVRIERAQLFAH